MSHTSHHRAEILASDVCGCFSCLKTFHPVEISEWCDEVEGQGQTAICPHCGVDSILGSASGIQLTIQQLTRYRDEWFK